MKSNEIKFHFDIEQGSEAWKELRLGLFTASEIHKLIWSSKITEGAITYIETKISEELTGTFQDVDSQAMAWGRMYEPYARQFYEKATGEEITQVGFITNSIYENCGISPDGVNFELKKGYEIKCPFNPVNHLKLMQCKNAADLKVVKKEYYWQVLESLLISEFDSWQFISFHADFTKKKDLRMWTFEIKRSEVLADLNLLSKQKSEANEYRSQVLQSIEQI